MKIKSKSKILENNMGMIIAVSLLLTITVFFFGPLEIFLSKPAEFWFSVFDVLPIILVSTLAVFLFLFGILLLISSFGQKALKIVTSVLAGIGMAFYVQGNWTFVNYGEMDGTPIDWSSYSGWSVIDSCMWFAIIALVIVLMLSKPQFTKVYMAVFYGIVGVEIITLVILSIGSIGADHKADYALTTEGELQLSAENNNIVVVLADGFDGSNFLPILEAEPMFEESFSGFTFYKDTCGTSLFSEESGITLLTGNQFEAGLTFSDNVKNAYTKSVLYDKLAENGYKTYLYIQNEKLIPPEISDRLENFEESRAEIKGFSNAFVPIYKMVGFRYAPHVLKPFFWYSTMDFYSLKGSSAYQWSNLTFYNFIRNEGVSTDNNDSNIYQFYWIKGPHEPVTMDRYCEPLDKNVEMSDSNFSDSQFEQSIGVVRIFTELIASIKEAGVYDNTTIIFTADHGWDIRPNPLLLVKPAGVRGDFKISNAPVSMIEDYMPTLLYFVTENKDHGDTIYELGEEQKRSRPFYVYDINAGDRTYNIIATSVYEAGIFSEKYNIGEKLNADNIVVHAVRGLSHSEITHVWTDGNETELKFSLKGDYRNLLLELEYWTHGGAQQVALYANDYLVEDYVADGVETKQITIPGDFVNDGQLILRFEFRDATSPKDLMQGNDARKLALALKSFTISSID